MTPCLYFWCFVRHHILLLYYYVRNKQYYIIIVNSSGGIILTNKLSIVQVIDKNTLRWFGLVMGRKEESMLRVVMHLKTKGKRPRGNTTWLDSIDRH